MCNRIEINRLLALLPIIVIGGYLKTFADLMQKCRKNRFFYEVYQTEQTQCSGGKLNVLHVLKLLYFCFVTSSKQRSFKFNRAKWLVFNGLNSLFSPFCSQLVLKQLYYYVVTMSQLRFSFIFSCEIFPDFSRFSGFSLTAFKFPDNSRFSRYLATMNLIFCN